MVKIFDNKNIKLDNYVGKLNELANSIGYTDDTFQKFLLTTQESGTSYSNAQEALAGYQSYLKSTSKSLDFAALKATALNVALNAGIILAVTLAIKGLAVAWDNVNVTVAEQQEKLDGIKSRYQELQSEYDTLSQKQDLTDAEKRRLEYLERRLELDEKILEAETQQLYKERYNGGFTSLFDEDNLNAKALKETGILNKLGITSFLTDSDDTFVSAKADYIFDKGALENIQSQIALYQELQSSVKEGSSQWESYQSSITSLREKEDSYLEKLSNQENQLVINLGRYADEINTIEADLSSGELTGEAEKNASENLIFYRSLYAQTELMISSIQKLNGTYNETLSVLDQIDDKYGGGHSDGVAADVNRTDSEKSFREFSSGLSEDDQKIVNSEEFANALERVKENLNGAELSAEDYAEALSIVNGTLEDVSAFDPSKFSDQLSALTSLQNAYQNFKDDVKNGVDFTFDFSSIESLREKFGDVCSSFDEFERLATTVGTSTDDMQDAFDQLINEYVYGSGILDGLNTENREQIISQLELQDIENASQIITEELAAAKEYATQAGVDLSDATAEEIAALLNETDASGVSGEALAQFELAKRFANGTLINTNDDIDQVIALANAAGASAEVVANLTRAKAALESGGTSSMIGWAEDYINKVNSGNVDFGFQLDANQFKAGSGKKSKSGGGSGSSKDLYKEAYEKELSALEHKLAMELISEREYYDELNRLNEAYFGQASGNHEKYLDEYQSNEEKIFKGLKKIREDALKEEKSSLDDVISHVVSLVDKKINSYKDKMDSVTEEYEKQKEAAIDRYEKEIEKTEEQIDAKQDEIDAIHDINDAVDKQKALEEALYNLRRAQNQKSRVYKQTDGTNGQVIYDVNSKEISSASDEVYKAQNELRISQLEQEKEALEELKDSYEEKKEKIEEYYDNLISSTEEYYNRLIEGQEAIKSRWEELSELQEQAEIQAKLDELGLLEQGVADMSDEAFQRLKLSYLDVLKDMNEGNGGILNQLSILSGVDMSGLMGYLETSQGMLAGLAGINIQPVNDSLALIPEQTAVAETAIVNTTEQAKQQIGQVSETLNNLTNDISAYQLPPLNTEQFSASLGADGVGGVLQDLNTFVQRFRDICGSIPQIWNDTLSILQGTQGSVSGEGTDYNSIFAPLITAMNNCKLQMDGKLTEYVNAWKQFNLDLGGIIGIGTSTGDGLALPTSPIKSKDASGGKDTGKSDSSEGGDTIVGSIQTGGKMITDSFTNEWIPAFSNLGTNINEICGKIVLCVNEMAAETVNACREAIDAINKANAAKKSSSSKNKKPAKFEGAAYVGQAFARGSDLSIDRTQVALVNEIGQEGIVRNGKLHTVYGGAQFVTLQKGDIVFNHKQMEELQKHRRVASDGGHGTMIGSFAGGSSLKINEPPKKLQAMITPEFKRAITPDLHLPGLERMLEPTGSPQTNIHQDIKVTLPNVTNEAGFHHFAKELKNLKLEALQRSYRRM